MGLGSGGPQRVFLNVTKGKFINKAANMEGVTFDGKLVAIERKEDEYEGKKVWKGVIVMRDEADGKDYAISFLESGYFSLGFFSRISSVDVDRAFTLGVTQSDKNEKISFCYIKQDGQLIKKDENFPKPSKVEVSPGNEVTVWTDCVKKFMEVGALINAKLMNGPGNDSASSNNSTVADTGAQADDDLPF